MNIIQRIQLKDITYYPGDLVVIRDWDDMEKEFGLNPYEEIKCRRTFTPGMKFMCSKKYILKIHGNSDIKEQVFDINGYYISPDMIRLVKRGK